MRRRSCGIVVAVLAALLVGLGIGIWLMGGAQIVHFLTVGDRGVITPPANKPGPLHVTFTEQQLTDQLRAAVKTPDAKDLSVVLKPGLMVVTGQLKKGPLESPFEVELTPIADSGHVKVVVKKASLGHLPLPSEISSLLGQYAARALAQQQEKIPGLVVDTVTVRPGVMDVTGHMEKPAKK
jgi:hypothetical protein